MATNPDPWMANNQRFLAASLAQLRRTIHERLGQNQSDPVSALLADTRDDDPAALADLMTPAPALTRLQTLFSLTQFERDLVLLCAAVDLDSTFAKLLGQVHGDPLRTFPTFGLALSVLSDPHWSALAPSSAVRQWQLVEVGSGPSLTQSPLRIDERVLHFLTGVLEPDERIMNLVEPLASNRELVPSQDAIARSILDVWVQSREKDRLPVIQLCGSDLAGKRDIATAAFRALNCSGFLITADMIPTAPGDLDRLAMLWRREVRLSSSALLIDCDDLDLADGHRTNAVSWFVDRLSGPVVVVSQDRLRMRQRPTIVFDVGKPNRAEQQQIWQAALAPYTDSLNGSVDSVTAQFNLSTSVIQAASNQVLARRADAGIGEISHLLWDACRAEIRPQLDDLAQRLDPSAEWDDLVLPAPQQQLLREIAMHVRQRATVYDLWGFNESGSRGLGISALFAGASGTGKTMAAEVLAAELRLDLYRIDLSSIVSKYIGETEKNLRRVFDAAENGGTVLLFDEADALFGKRSEVKDSHDRYANIEVSYLLQRMESFRGLSILTTNFKSALDSAFLRRIRFVVPFPFPDAQQRAEIWRRVFPTNTPTCELDVHKLARLGVAGGNIRNIALSAAFLAADAREPIRMEHLLLAARTEYAKLEKPLTEAEIAGWG